MSLSASVFVPGSDGGGAEQPCSLPLGRREGSSRSHGTRPGGTFKENDTDFPFYFLKLFLMEIFKNINI